MWQQAQTGLNEDHVMAPSTNFVANVICLSTFLIGYVLFDKCVLRGSVNSSQGFRVIVVIKNNHFCPKSHWPYKFLWKEWPYIALEDKVHFHTSPRTLGCESYSSLYFTITDMSWDSVMVRRLASELAICLPLDHCHLPRMGLFCVFFRLPLKLDLHWLFWLPCLLNERNKGQTVGPNPISSTAREAMTMLFSC